MSIGQSLTLSAIALQSVGKVLYGTLLAGISTPLFVLVSVCLTAGVFIVSIRFRLPKDALGLLAQANVWTAISFISLFFALKHLPPAMFASIEIGMSLLTAVAVASVQSREWPRKVRILACAGIVAGCALLSWTEIGVSTSEGTNALVWVAIAASAATGFTSALSAITSKKLAASGWSSASILAHRFYLTIAAALIWLPMEQQDLAVPEASAFALMAMIGTIGILIPLLLLQVALRQTDAVTVMICMAAQPILSFAFSVPSPAYDWDTLTLIGVLLVTLFVALDIHAQRRLVPATAS